jgi:hypothetical protein
MTPTRYRECLDFLGLSQRGLAPILQCSDRFDTLLGDRTRNHPAGSCRLAQSLGCGSVGAPGSVAAGELAQVAGPSIRLTGAAARVDPTEMR